MRHLLPFRLPREREGQICEAPTATPLCRSLGRTASEANTSEESERRALLTPPGSCPSLTPP